jgi:hypothetical protein
MMPRAAPAASVNSMQPERYEPGGLTVSSGPLVAGAVLVGVGGLLALVGFAVSGAALATAVRRWVNQMEVPPNELARQQFARAKAATSAGASAWRQTAPSSS